MQWPSFHFQIPNHWHVQTIRILWAIFQLTIFIMHSIYQHFVCVVCIVPPLSPSPLHLNRNLNDNPAYTHTYTQTHRNISTLSAVLGIEFNLDTRYDMGCVWYAMRYHKLKGKLFKSWFKSIVMSIEHACKIVQWCQIDDNMRCVAALANFFRRHSENGVTIEHNLKSEWSLATVETIWMIAQWQKSCSSFNFFCCCS